MRVCLKSCLHFSIHRHNFASFQTSWASSRSRGDASRSATKLPSILGPRSLQLRLSHPNSVVYHTVSTTQNGALKNNDSNNRVGKLSIPILNFNKQNCAGRRREKSLDCNQKSVMLSFLGRNHTSLSRTTLKTNIRDQRQ